jgi:hypothetical protein
MQDIHQMKIKNWTACVQDRATWRNIIEKAKTSKEGGQSPYEEEEEEINIPFHT